ncbi:MAG: hypothetical protein IKD40_05795 [Bacteroidaceae bacterium]|nr:hypothetical protein [Bacteroidaceae bacterium]
MMRRIKHILAILCVAQLCCTANVRAQQPDSIQIEGNITTVESIIKQDSLESDRIYNEEIIPVNDGSLIINKQNKAAQPIEKERFLPDPQKATWLAVVFPGAGQIYNRKYWKLPIVYGGFIGCLYAYNWNSQMYKDYRQAFLDIMDADPNTKSYEEFFRPGYDFEANREYMENVFKKRKDRYRRWRDLSVFAFIGVYALSVIDAYVDAQLANFDISDNINLSINPKVIQSRATGLEDNYYGLNCNLTF